MFDLVALEVQAQRDAAKFTLITRTNGEWEPGECTKLLRLNRPINGHPQYPTVLIILDEHSFEAITGVLGHSNFTREVVQGYGNGRLPFTPVV